MNCKYVGKAIFVGKPDKVFPFMETGGVYDIVVNESQQGQFSLVNPIYCPYSSWEALLQNWELLESTPEAKPETKPVADGWTTVTVGGWSKHRHSHNFTLPLPKSKPKKDMYGEDSPLYIQTGEVAPVVTKWMTRDMTDSDYIWKLSKEDLDHLIRDVCYLIYRKRQMLARQSLQITTTSMKSKPAKKVGSKVKKVNALKKAVTAKSKKLLKAKKK